MKKLEAIDNKEDFFKFWSVRLGIVGTALTSFMIAFPDLVLHAWGVLPPELKSAIPPQYMPFIGVMVFVASIIARRIKQKKLQKPDIEISDAGIVDHE